MPRWVPPLVAPHGVLPDGQRDAVQTAEPRQVVQVGGELPHEDVAEAALVDVSKHVAPVAPADHERGLASALLMRNASVRMVPSGSRTDHRIPGFRENSWFLDAFARRYRYTGADGAHSS